MKTNGWKMTCHFVMVEFHGQSVDFREGIVSRWFLPIPNLFDKFIFWDWGLLARVFFLGWCRNLVREQKPSVKIVSPSVGCATCVSFSLPLLFAALLHPRRLSLFCLWVLSQVRQSDSKLTIDRVSWQGYLTRFLRVGFIVNWLASSHLIQHGQGSRNSSAHDEDWFRLLWSDGVMVMLDSYSAGGNGRKMRQGIPLTTLGTWTFLLLRQLLFKFPQKLNNARSVLGSLVVRNWVAST